MNLFVSWWVDESNLVRMSCGNLDSVHSLARWFGSR